MFRAGDFFAFMREREQIRLRKEADLVALEQGEAPQGPPWTTDPILSKYKFTNVFRQYDRTSRELRERFYTPHFDSDPRDILMNCALFRYFGTWEFAVAAGWQSYESFDFEGIKDLAKSRLEERKRVFTGAYVITNQGISAPKQEVVVDYFLKDLHAQTPYLVGVSESTLSWESVAAHMRTIKGFGGSGFMTKEVLLDTTYTGFWPFEHDRENHFSFPEDWWDWTPIGPGARRGASRVLGDDTAKPVSEAKAFDVIMDLVKVEYQEWPKEWPNLAPTDIQFQLCEFDKYERVRLGQGKPRSMYRP